MLLKLNAKLANQYIDLHSINNDFINTETVSLAAAKLNQGNAAGLDGLQAEHLYFAHLILLVVLSKLFSLILKFGYVPNDFGKGMLIPIPKVANNHGIMSVDNFRGITISPIISKLFEHCILMMYKDYLYSSSRQFGFKSELGCTNAIYTARKVIDHFVANDSTVNVCCLDISKAFDRVSQSGLLIKLMDRGVPKCLVTVLYNWFQKSFCCIKWNLVMSTPFKITAGVRQGGVLSPIFFSVYVDDILVKLENNGCFLHGLNLGSLMYADDLVLLAPSVTELQTMIDICCLELTKIDLLLNESKSVCIRIGKRWHQKCVSLVTPNGRNIEWSNSTVYLGVKLNAGVKFSFDLDRPKSKFYSSFNSIYSKLGRLNSPIVTLNLIHSMSIPSLLFAIEVLPLSKSILKSMEHPWSKVFMKIFSTFDAKSISLCQYYTGFLPIEYIALSRKTKFLKSLTSSSHWLMKVLGVLCAQDELTNIAVQYNTDVNELCNSNFMNDYFCKNIESNL